MSQKPHGHNVEERLKTLLQTILHENSYALLAYVSTNANRFAEAVTFQIWSVLSKNNDTCALITEHKTFKSTISFAAALPSAGLLTAVLDLLAGVLDFQKSAIAGTPFFITLPFVIAFFAESCDKIPKNT